MSGEYLWGFGKSDSDGVRLEGGGDEHEVKCNCIKKWMDTESAYIGGRAGGVLK